MVTAGRCTEIRHTSQVPLPCAAEGQRAKGKRRTTAKSVTWCVSAKESNGIDLVGRPVSRVNSVNQEVRCADKGETDNAGQPPWHPELDVSHPRTVATWASKIRHAATAAVHVLKHSRDSLLQDPSASLPIAQAFVPGCFTPRLVSLTTSLILLNAKRANTNRRP